VVLGFGGEAVAQPDARASPSPRHWSQCR
jgi:hypothetical protein